MEKVRNPVLYLAVAFIADQSPKLKDGIGAISTFKMLSLGLHRETPYFSTTLLCDSEFGFPDHVLPCLLLLSLLPYLPAFAPLIAFQYLYQRESEYQYSPVSVFSCICQLTVEIKLRLKSTDIHDWFHPCFPIHEKSKAGCFCKHTRPSLSSELYLRLLEQKGIIQYTL